MLIQTNRLKRDYKITYTYAVDEEAIDHGHYYTTIIKDCYSESEAFERWYNTLDYDYYDLDITAVERTHTDKVNQQVYELVLADLFEGEIGVYEWIDTAEEDIEITEDLTGLERIIVEHEAYNKYLNKNRIKTSK